MTANTIAARAYAWLSTPPEVGFRSAFIADALEVPGCRRRAAMVINRALSRRPSLFERRDGLWFRTPGLLERFRA